MNKALILGIAIAIAAQAVPVLADEGQPMIIAESKPFVATSAQVQHFTDSINLKPGQEKLQLTLTYYNGSATAPGFKWLRISSPSMSYVSEQNFDGQKSFSTDASGDLSWGGNQLLITADGQPGSTFSWVLTALNPHISGADTTAVAPGGTLTINGTNLCASPSADSVTIDGQPATVTSATTTALHVTVPEYISGGAHKAVVAVAGIDCGSVPFAVNAVPYLTKLSSAWVPPGSNLTIYGENFTSDPSKAVVYIGPLRAPLVSTANDQITVSIPASYDIAWAGFYMPVKVTIGGVKARNTLKISCASTSPI